MVQFAFPCLIPLSFYIFNTRQKIKFVGGPHAHTSILSYLPFTIETQPMHPSTWYVMWIFIHAGKPCCANPKTLIAVGLCQWGGTQQTWQALIKMRQVWCNMTSQHGIKCLCKYKYNRERENKM